MLNHPDAQGDGVRARIVSSRFGLLGEWTVHHTKLSTNVAEIEVQKGDLIDFIVDPISNDGYDAFSWSPRIRSVRNPHAWDAASGFSGPTGPAIKRLALYAQALMMTNEFMFVD